MIEDLKDPNRAVKPCIRCGACNRSTNGQCRPCMAAKSKKWRAENPDKAKALREKWALENPEKVKAAVRKWNAAHAEELKSARVRRYAQNPERERETNARWYAGNKSRVKALALRRRAADPDISRLKNHVRRARRQALGGSLSKGLTARLFSLQKGLCACCRRPLGKDFHLDHVMPLALGGANVDSNTQLLRSECNRKKGAKHPAQYMRERGFLL